LFVCLFVCFFQAAFGGMQPLGRSPMRSSRRSLSYTSIKAVMDSVSNHFSLLMLTASRKKVSTNNVLIFSGNRF